MECVDIIHRWTVNKKPDKCSCWVVDNPQKPYILFLDMVNEVIIRFKGKSPAHLFEVVHHMNDQPWRIVNKYLYFNQTTSSLTIPIPLCALSPPLLVLGHRPQPDPNLQISVSTNQK